MEVSFLCNRDREIDTDDYKNLTRLMKYIKCTIGLPFILSIDKSGNIKWYVDTKFTLHNDMRRHADGFMTTVKGRAYASLSKQLNTKISTEAKLFGVDNFLTQIIWIQ